MLVTLKLLFYRISCYVAGGWYILRDWNEADFDANFLLRELHVKYGATPYFQISVQPNPLFPGHSSISISPAGLGLPDRKYYYGTQDDPVSIKYYLKFLNKKVS